MTAKTQTKTAKAQATTVITPDVKTRIVQYIRQANAGGKFLNFEANNQDIRFAVYMDNATLEVFKPQIGTIFEVLSNLHKPANVKGTGTKTVPAVKVPITEFEGQKQQVLNPYSFRDGIVKTRQPEVNPDDLTLGD